MSVDQGLLPHAKRDAFLGWQCRSRQAAMRLLGGRPDGPLVPRVVLQGSERPQQIVTVLCRKDECSVTPELIHMARRTADPAERHSNAVRYFSSTYFRSWRDFCDTITASFAPRSEAASAYVEAKACRLVFEAYSHVFDLICRVVRLEPAHPLRAATWWHNYLFNPKLHPDSEILGFQPDWTRAKLQMPA